MVDWSRPQKTTTSITLLDPSTGHISSDPAQVAELLSEQFTPHNAGSADLSILKELNPHAV
jgi:hypothetical protein